MSQIKFVCNKRNAKEVFGKDYCNKHPNGNIDSENEVLGNCTNVKCPNFNCTSCKYYTMNFFEECYGKCILATSKNQSKKCIGAKRNPRTDFAPVNEPANKITIDSNKKESEKMISEMKNNGFYIK